MMSKTVVKRIINNSMFDIWQTVGLETARDGVTCMAICPGYVDTVCKYINWTSLMKFKIMLYINCDQLYSA